MTTPPHPKDRIPKEFIITENQLNDLVTGHLDIEDELRIMEFVRSRPAHASSRRIERETDVIEAAKTWWMMHRPVTYSSQEHLANPDINCPTKADGFLARAVAALLRGERE